MSATYAMDLFPAEVLQPPITEIELDRLPANEDLIGSQPKERFVAEIRDRGVRQPIMLVEDGQGHYGVCFGTRRIKAARKCGHKTIPARIYPVGTVNPHAEAVAENDHREENVARHCASIAHLRGQGHVDAEIQKEMHLDSRRFKARCAILDHLAANLLHLFYEGRMGGKAAEAAAKLSPELQQKLAVLLDERQQEMDAKYPGKGRIARLTAKDVHDVSRRGTVAAWAAEDDDMFATPGVADTFGAPTEEVEVPWHVKVGRLLQKAHDLIPDEEDSMFREMIANVIDAVVDAGDETMPDSGPYAELVSGLAPDEPPPSPPKTAKRPRKPKTGATDSLLGEE